MKKKKQKKKTKKTETLLTQFWVIIYISSEFNFYEKNKHFIDSILGNNLHNY